MASYPTTSLAAVLGADGLRTTQLDVPVDLPAGGLLPVEAAAVCGSDLAHYADKSFRQLGGVILGHETAGSIVALDDKAAARWDLEVGDRVYVEEFIGCKSCRFCLTGRYNLCEATDWTAPRTLRYGRTPTNVAPGLWGGFSQYLYLHPDAVLHQIPDSLSSELAVWANPVANGMRWINEIASLRPGERVVIAGPGPHGLGCAIAARQLASEVVLVGLPGDEGRLNDARSLGVDHTYIAAAGQLEQCFSFRDGSGADVVVDLTQSHEVLRTALATVSKAGRIVLAGHKVDVCGSADLPRLARRELSLLGVSGPTYDSVRAALKYLDANSEQMANLNTLVCGIENVEWAFQVVAGDEGPRPTHAVITDRGIGGESRHVAKHPEWGGAS